MPKCYIAMRLDPLDALAGRLPQAEDYYPCAICSNYDAAYDYSKNAELETDYPTLTEKLGVPPVSVIATYNTKYPVPEGALECTTDIITQMEGAPTARVITIGADKIHGSISLAMEAQNMDVDKMAYILRQRLEVNAQLEKAQEQYPTCDGLAQWFRHIEEHCDDFEGFLPDYQMHVPVYTQAFYDTREAYPQLSREIVILQAEIQAARAVALENEEWYEEFQNLADTTLRSLYRCCAQELVFFQPTDYLTRTLPQVPAAYQDSFLNAFNETLDNIQENHPEWTSEQQAAHAMDQTAYLMVNTIIDKQMEGVFGRGPKITREEYMELEQVKSSLIMLQAETHKNIELVDHMVDQLRDAEFIELEFEDIPREE